MKKTFISAVLFLLVSLVPAAGEGNTAMPFVQIGRNPVSVSMAGAAGVLADNPYASLENMAATAFGTSKLSVGAGYQLYAPSFQKSTAINAGLSYRVSEKMNVSASFVTENGEPYDVLTNIGAQVGTFTPKDMLISAGASYLITENISAGAAFHFASQTLSEDYSASAVCFDLHAAYKTGSLLVSAGLNTFGGSVASTSGDKYPLPASVNLSGTYNVAIGESMAVDPYFKGEYFLSGGIGAALGAQFSFKEMVFARAGYHYAAAEAPIPSFASVGLGAKFAGVSLDLAYILASETLSGSMIIGLGYAF